MRSVLLILLLPYQTLAQQLFSESMLKADLLYYQAKLEQHHPNLYLYSSKEKVDWLFDSLSHSIRQPLSEAEFYQKITLSSSTIKDGHTLILPSAAFIEHQNAKSKFLPFQIGLNDQKLYVKMNCTHAKQISEGTIVDSINGLAADLIINNLLSRQVMDGENLAYAKWIIDSYFREYYSYIFGHPEHFRIAYTKDNHSYAIHTKGLTKDSIFYYREKNYPLSFSANTSGKGIFLSYPQNQQVGILTIKDFHSDALKSEYQQKFRTAIKAIFAELIQNQVPNLVIDLRNNQGGDVENGVLLLKYLLNKPFSVVNTYEKVKNGSLSKARGPSMGLHQPKAKVYKGQIYVLLNGGSFSNAVIVSSCLGRYSNALFVGTESGGNPNVLAGYAKDFELPNTHIKVQVPTIRFIMSSLAQNTGAGIVPNHQIEHHIEDHIQQSDPQLAFLLDLIRRKSQGE
jgi:hypothetical protein